jgi:TatD DNase family protein
MSYVDAHCHLSDPRLQDQWQSYVESAQKNNIRFFMLGGQFPSEWQAQVEMLRIMPDSFGLSFGLHPYFVAKNTNSDCEAALDLLAQLLPQAMALGELGLDFRDEIIGDSYERQIQFFADQLELAKSTNKPAILHVVKAHDEALRVIDFYADGVVRGIIHGFTGSIELAEEYTKRGLLISIGTRLLFENARKLRATAAGLPLSKILLESDMPDQPPPNWSSGFNSCESLLMVAQEIGNLRGISREEVLSKCTSNFWDTFKGTE